MAQKVISENTAPDKWGDIRATFHLANDLTAEIVVTRRKGAEPRVNWYGTTGSVDDANGMILLLATASAFASSLEAK